MSAYLEEGKSASNSLSGITAELNGFLNQQRDEIFDYVVKPKGSEEEIESKSKGRVLSGLIDGFDMSRDTYGTTNWRGTATKKEEGTDLRIVIEYSSVVDRSELPPRSMLLEEESYEIDPYNIITEPVEVLIEGETDILYQNISAIT